MRLTGLKLGLKPKPWLPCCHALLHMAPKWFDHWTTSAGHHSRLVAEIFTISINLSISSTFQVSRHFAGW